MSPGRRRTHDLFGTPLTERERQVFDLVAKGLDAPDIGEKLFLAEATIRTHQKNLRYRLGASTLAHAVAILYGRKINRLQGELVELQARLAGLNAENPPSPGVTQTRGKV